MTVSPEGSAAEPSRAALLNPPPFECPLGNSSTTVVQRRCRGALLFCSFHRLNRSSSTSTWNLKASSISGTCLFPVLRNVKVNNQIDRQY